MNQKTALIIGNREYSDRIYQKLPQMGQHVHDLERLFSDSIRCNFEVTALSNSPKSSIEKHVVDFFKNKSIEDLLVLYILGYAVKDIDGTVYFLTGESENASVEITSISTSFIGTMIKKCSSKNIVVILDCSFIGESIDDFHSAIGEIVEIEAAFQFQRPQCIILTASDKVQYTCDRKNNDIYGEAEDISFTHYFIEGISTGKADANNSGEITVSNIFSYVLEQTIKTFPKQSPKKFATDRIAEIVIANNPQMARLSSELVEAIHHPSYFTRLGAVRELENMLYLYDGQRPQVVDMCVESLRAMTADTNTNVAAQAKNVLSQFEKGHSIINLAGNARRFKLFVSSPSDVITERMSVFSVVERLNHDDAFKSFAQIEVIAYDNPINPLPLLAHISPQESINTDMLLPSQCDIVLVIFWSRFGTQLPPEIVKEDGSRYESGTEWEYLDAIRGAKLHSGYPIVLVYRNDQDITINRSSDGETQEKISQLMKVERFFSSFKDTDGSLKGGYNLYKGSKQFENILEKHLRAIIRRLITTSNEEQPIASATANAVPPQVDINSFLEPYLKWLIEQHSELELRGLGGDARLPRIPLEKVYVALKGSRSNAYEREQSQTLLNSEILDILSDLDDTFSATELARLIYYADRRAIVTNPYMPSVVDRDRPDDISGSMTMSALITLGEAFCKERWMVILGDPGSGKTTLARWLVLRLAIAMLNNEPEVMVPAYQVDPSKDKSDTSMINLGPPRLPILLRISEFSEKYQQERNRLESLSLIDFLGQHSWLNQRPDIPRENLNQMMKYYLKSGRAVVILDGMDEITGTIQRDEMVRAIETFIVKWINGRGNVAGVYDSAFWKDPEVRSEPATTGGNQIVITSRIAGYHAAPIPGEITHVTIQPMQKVAVGHFCDAWTLATYELFMPKEEAEQKAGIESSELKNAIFDPSHPRIRELATNPLLVTILALVYRNNHGHLPEQRVKLYETAMRILIEAWRATSITTIELNYVLSPLAAHIHQNYSTGLIEEREMTEIITNELAHYRQLDLLNLPPSFILQVSAFIQKVREEVGILAERSEHVYGFLHLTFQEYLAALYLVRNKHRAAEEISDKMNDPRWREPILMALGHISVSNEWGPRAQQEVLKALLEVDNPLGDLIPSSALLIVAAIPEMPNVSEDIIIQILEKLVLTYANRHNTVGFEILQRNIEQSIKTLVASSHRTTIERWFANSLKNRKLLQGNLLYAIADVVARNQWFDKNIIQALVDIAYFDSADWEFPITRALNMALIPKPDKITPKTVLFPPQPPASNEEQSRELSRLQQEAASGPPPKELRDHIAALQANFDAEWQTYVRYVQENEIGPRRKRIENIQNGQYEAELLKQLREASQQGVFGFLQKNSQQQKRQRIEQELEAVHNGSAVSALEDEIQQFETEIQ